MIAAAVIVVAVAAYVFWPKSAPSGPAVLSLIDPIGGVVVSTQPTLRWSDPENRVSYVLEYALDSGFAESRTIAGLTGGTYTFPSALPNGEYYWRLYPILLSGSPGEPSAAGHFVISATSAPAQGTMSIAVTPTGDIFLNDALVARDQSSWESTLDTGRYVVKVENDRSREKRLIDTAHVGVDARVSRSFAFTFPSAPPSQPSQQIRLGEVRVGSQPRGADILIDGDLQRQKTNYTFKLKPGRHVIVAALELQGVTHRLVDTVHVMADSVHKVLFDFEQ